MVRKGFVQYQFVLPLSAREQDLLKFSTSISDKGLGSFLAVLKSFRKTG